MEKIIINKLLNIIGKSLIILLKYDTRIKNELKFFPKKYVVSIQSIDNYINFKIENKQISICDIENVDLQIGVKDSHSLFEMLIGKKSLHQGFAENRFIIKGNLFLAMKFIRMLYICQGYLFTKKTLAKILKNNPTLEIDKIIFFKQLLSGGNNDTTIL